MKRSMTEANAKITSSQYYFEVAEHQWAKPDFCLRVPEFELGDNPADYAELTLNFFRELWDENGYSPIRQPHHDVIGLPGVRDEPPIILVNSYRGLSDGQVADRRPYLEHYKAQRAKLDTLTDPAKREAQNEKLTRILKHIPDVGGLQGIEEYAVIIPQSHRTANRYRLTWTGNIVARQTYCLDNEARDYDLPTRQNAGGLPCYPHVSSLAGVSLHVAALTDPAEQRQLLEHLIPRCNDSDGQRFALARTDHV